MSRILDAKYKKDYLNKVITEQCQHLSPRERENILKLLKYMKICSMELLARVILPRLTRN